MNEYNFRNTIFNLKFDNICHKYAFYIRRKGESAVFEANAERFSSASIIKIPILLACAALERAGQFSLDEICDLDAEPPVYGAGFSHRLRARRLPYHDVLLMMIANSDNLCSNLVVQRVGIERLNAIFQQELGLTNGTELQRKLMDFEARARGLDNWISAHDCVHLFELIEALPQSSAPGWNPCCGTARILPCCCAILNETASILPIRPAISQACCTIGAIPPIARFSC